VALAQALADSPQTILQTLADTILLVFQCGSAGISLLTMHDGGKTFYWPAIAGIWKPHIGGGTPRDFGPCGDVLDRNTPLLFTHVERLYTYFQQVTPPVEECLLVPFYAQGKAVGTIWAIAHDTRRQFGCRGQTAACQSGPVCLGGISGRGILERRETTRSDRRVLGRCHSQQRPVTGSSPVGMREPNGSLDIVRRKQLVNWPPSCCLPIKLDGEPRILERILSGEPVVHYETTGRCKDGTLVDISLAVSPMRDAKGQVIGISNIARDTTARKKAEKSARRGPTPVGIACTRSHARPSKSSPGNPASRRQLADLDGTAPANTGRSAQTNGSRFARQRGTNPDRSCP